LRVLVKNSTNRDPLLKETTESEIRPNNMNRKHGISLLTPGTLPSTRWKKERRRFSAGTRPMTLPCPILKKVSSLLLVSSRTQGPRTFVFSLFNYPHPYDDDTGILKKAVTEVFTVSIVLFLFKTMFRRMASVSFFRQKAYSVGPTR
jgi:hypothetical protein